MFIMKNVFLLLLFYRFTEGADETDTMRLRQELLRNYDRNARPVQNHRNATVVEIYIYNYGFEFNEKRGVVTLHALLVLEWKDQHMRWDPLMYGNLSSVNFYPTELWRPDIKVYDSGDEKGELDHLGNTLITVYNNTQIFWYPPAKLVSMCNDVDYYRWPYDRQRCKIRIASWAHDGDDIDTQIHENHTKMGDNPFHEQGVLSNREWDLVDNSVKLKTWEYDCCPDEGFKEIIIQMDIQRRFQTSVAGVVVVGIGITAAILISFWLNPYSAERVPVILVAFLLNSAYLNFIYSFIPGNGERVPWIVCYFRDSLVMVSLALAWTIALRYIAKTKRNSTVPLPLWVDKILDGIVGTILCLNPRPNSIENSEKPGNVDVNDDDRDELVQKEIIYRGDWGWFASVLDRIAFFIYLIVYFCFIITF